MSARITAVPADDIAEERLQVELFAPPMAPEQWDAYERATHSFECTRQYLEHFEDLSTAWLGLVRSGPHVEAAFIYRIQPGGDACVLGKYYAPSAEPLRVFIDAVFARHSGVNGVRTNLVDALPDPRVLRRPVLALRETRELRLSLPRTVEEYNRSLRRTALKRLERCERRFARDHPLLRLDTLEGDEIVRPLVADVIRLNRERMASKNTESIFREGDVERIFTITRARGYVTVLREGERLCAGVIIVRSGTDAFYWIIGHDNAYGKYRPGSLCLLAGIRHAVVRGVDTLHMLEGESDYKSEMGGVAAPLAAYLVLRSWAALRPGDVVRLLAKHAELRVRSVIDALDSVAQGVLTRRRPIRHFVRGTVNRIARIAKLRRGMR
jgi:hypothetical protein